MSPTIYSAWEQAKERDNVSHIGNRGLSAAIKGLMGKRIG